MLHAAQLDTTSYASRDRIWAATLQCGLGSVPSNRSAAQADAAAITQTAQQNDLLREQGIAIPWDQVTQWEVMHFWTAERGLAADLDEVTKHRRLAASARNGGEVQI